MPEYLAPGVYVEEVETGIPPIEGVGTSTTGMVGMTRRGPTTGRPLLVTSMADFRRKYGGYFDFSNIAAGFAGHNALPYAVEGFFANGGRRLYLVRVPGQNAVPSQATASGGLTTRLLADAATGQKIVRPATLRGIAKGSKLLLRMVKNGIVTESGNVTVDTINRATGEVTVTANLAATPAGPTAFEARYTWILTDTKGLKADGTLDTLANPGDPAPASLKFKAADAGSWGDSIDLVARPETGGRVDMDVVLPGNVVDNNKVRLKSGAGFYPLAWVEIDRGNDKVYRKVKTVDGPVVTLLGPAIAANALDPQAPATTTVFSVCEFGLSASFEGVTEQYAGLTLEKVTGKYVVDRLNGISNLLSIDTAALPAGTEPFLFPSGSDGLHVVLGSGSDGNNPPTDLAYVGTDGGPGLRTGIKALEDVDEVAILAAPGQTSQTVQNELINQCERLMDRFCILDPKPKSVTVGADLKDIQDQRGLYDTKYAALYYPRILVTDPLTGKSLPIPPSGHLAGIYARTDNKPGGGVHKAPANEVIAGIVGLEATVNKGEQEILNPLNINVIRDFRADNRGYRVWGARCLTSLTQWKYVPVRRLFIFLEESIDQGTQWVVFEPNSYPTWKRVKQSVVNFLTTVWRDGALMGTKPEEAFFVICDETTMTQDDIDNGRLIMVVGVAPVKPAEFVIIRIGQWSGGSSVSEQ